MKFLVAYLLVILSATFAFGQCGTGNRVQWQPSVAAGGFDPDQRLEQPLKIELAGRSAKAALELLSKQTGVNLTVGPESYYTTGERKLSIFAHGCTLKALMVQIPTALQECHWDIDTSGAKPVYLLHRNSDVDAVAAWLAQRAEAAASQETRALRANRLEAARQGLKMTPAEIAELEKTDLFLARSLREPDARNLLEVFLALPTDQMEQFLDNGRIGLNYAAASEPLQQAMKRVAQRFFEGKTIGSFNDGEVYEGSYSVGTGNPDGAEREKHVPMEERLKSWQNYLNTATITFEDGRTDFGFGVLASLTLRTKQGIGGFGDIALMPKYPSTDDGDIVYQQLLLATGTPDKEAASDLIRQWEHAGFAYDKQKTEQRRAAEWQVPEDPALQRNITVGDRKFADLAEAQQFISRETGLNIVSDYFTERGFYLPDEARAEIPLWRLLYFMGESRSFRPPLHWEKAGNCLVFYHGDWYELAPGEAPESLLLTMRERLQKNGKLTLDDLAEVAVAVEGTHIRFDALPRDLTRAGLSVISWGNWALSFYASMTPEQIKQAHTTAGLPYKNMTLAQKNRVLERVKKQLSPVPPEEAVKATFHIKASTKARGQIHWVETELWLDFSGRRDVVPIILRLPAAAAAK